MLGSLPLAAQSVIMTTDQSPYTPLSTILRFLLISLFPSCSIEYGTIRDWRCRFCPGREPNWSTRCRWRQACGTRRSITKCYSRLFDYGDDDSYQRRKRFAHLPQFEF